MKFIKTGFENILQVDVQAKNYNIKGFQINSKKDAYYGANKINSNSIGLIVEYYKSEGTLWFCYPRTSSGILRIELLNDNIVSSYEYYL